MGLHLGAVKPWVSSAAQKVEDQFGITNIGGWRSTGSVPNSDHPKGLALDVMIKNKTQGQEVADWSRTNAAPLGLTYVIWNRHIWSVDRNAEGWRPYTGPVPHTDHVHLSFKNRAPTGGGTVTNALTGAAKAGGLAGTAAGGLLGLLGIGEKAGESVNAVGDLAGVVTRLALPSMQLRIWSGVLGGILLIIGLVVLTREAVTS